MLSKIVDVIKVRDYMHSLINGVGAGVSKDSMRAIQRMIPQLDAKIAEEVLKINLEELFNEVMVPVPQSAHTWETKNSTPFREPVKDEPEEQELSFQELVNKAIELQHQHNLAPPNNGHLDLERLLARGFQSDSTPPTKLPTTELMGLTPEELASKLSSIKVIDKGPVPRSPVLTEAEEKAMVDDTVNQAKEKLKAEGKQNKKFAGVKRAKTEEDNG